MDVYVWHSVHLAYIYMYLLLLSPETWVSFVATGCSWADQKQAIKAPLYTTLKTHQALTELLYFNYNCLLYGNLTLVNAGY